MVKLETNIEVGKQLGAGYIQSYYQGYVTGWNLDTLSKHGILYYAADCVNKPDEGGGILFEFGGGDCVQLAIGFKYRNLYYRVKQAGVWDSNWTKVAKG